jgi:thiol-disulfide isomerase/thioredoxin
MQIHRKGLIVAWLLASLVLAACAGGTTETPLSALQVSSEAEISQEQAEEPNAPQPTAEETPAEEVDQNEEGVPALVMGSADFHETDPSTVVLASGQVQFIEFFAYWCTVCKAMAPSVHGLEQIYGDQVNFVYLDRDKDTTVELRNQLGYVYQPHIFILDAEGNILYQRSGYVEAVELQAQIESALN